MQRKYKSFNKTILNNKEFGIKTINPKNEKMNKSR